jgi:lysophospholipase L1-like esterase
MTLRRKLLFTAITLVGVFILIEGSARLVWFLLERRALDHSRAGRKVLKNDAVNFMKIADATYGYRLKPNFKMPGLTINSQGFHQRDEVPTTKTVSTLRIACLGESTTFGTNDDANYPAFLKQILSRHAGPYHAYEVINAGVPGWVSDQIAMRVRNQIAQFKPDVIILYVGWNDFQAFDPTGAPPAASAFDVMFGGTIWKQYATGALRSVALLSAAYQVFHPSRPSSQSANKPVRASPDVQYRFLIQNLSAIVEEFRKYNPNAQFFVSTLVGLWPQGTTQHWEEIKKGLPWWIVADKLLPAEGARYVSELNDTLRGFAASRNLHLIDMEAVFENLDRQRLQFDWAHMYPDGYELMAWNMCGALIRAGIVQGELGSRPEELITKYRLPAAAANGS